MRKLNFNCKYSNTCREFGKCGKCGGYYNQPTLEALKKALDEQHWRLYPQHKPKSLTQMKKERIAEKERAGK